MTFFAVTPAFADECIELLLTKDRWDYDFERFKALPTFCMSPLRLAELKALSKRIIEAHGIAYGWAPDGVMRASELEPIIENAAALRIQDRVRNAIRKIVEYLDDLLEGEQ